MAFLKFFSKISANPPETEQLCLNTLIFKTQLSTNERALSTSVNQINQSRDNTSRKKYTVLITHLILIKIKMSKRDDC